MIAMTVIKFGRALPPVIINNVEIRGARRLGFPIPAPLRCEINLDMTGIGCIGAIGNPTATTLLLPVPSARA